MQPQFESVRLMAQAYERELRADAVRVQPLPRSGDAGRRASRPRLTAGRRRLGTFLVRAGLRLQGSSRIAPAGGALTPANGLGPVR